MPDISAAEKGPPPQSSPLLRLRKNAVRAWFPLLLTVCGLLGFYASFVLTIDTFNLAAHPQLQLECNINPVISCGSVMKTREASLFGFANSLLGIPAYTIVVFLGVTALAGTVYKKWVWLGLQAGSFLGILLTHWLFYQSVFHIHALCPYCMLVWVVTMLVFWYTAVYNLQSGYLHAVPDSISRFCRRRHADIFLVWALVIAAVIIHQFWYYVRTLLPS